MRVIYLSLTTLDIDSRYLSLTTLDIDSRYLGTYILANTDKMSDPTSDPARFRTTGLHSMGKRPYLEENRTIFDTLTKPPTLLKREAHEALAA
jgi:hypothetical protein